MNALLRASFAIAVSLLFATACVVTRGHDPCSGKQVGDPCRLCPPDDPSCIETMEVKVCKDDGHAGLACGGQVPPQ